MGEVRYDVVDSYGKPMERVAQSGRNTENRAMRLFSYKLTDDTGFAPNPFWDVLTLATCKPQIRMKKGVGDWIAGFTSATLNGDRIGEERLVYLARITDKLTIAKYFRAPQFEVKKPIPDSPDSRLRCGDNIYRPLVELAAEPREFRQLRNDNHWDGEERAVGTCSPGPSRVRDISGRFVLISKEYAYFGAEPLPIPGHLRPDVPKGQSAHGSQTRDPSRVSAFIDFVLRVAGGRKLVCHPTTWNPDDATWKRRKPCAVSRNPSRTAKGKLNRRKGCT